MNVPCEQGQVRELQEGDKVMHDGKGAIILWINDDKASVAIGFVGRYSGHPKMWKVPVSDLTLL